MSTLTRPKGPLSPRVYWTRRLLLLAVVLALVVGIASVLTRGSDGSSTATARQVAAEPTGAPTASPGENQNKTKKNKKKQKKKKKKVLAEPTGVCSSGDIEAEPKVTTPVAGSRTLITVQLRTKVAKACTWTVSPDTLTMKITSGRDDIWSSRECPAAIPTREVVVRKAVATKVGVPWSGRRSDADCSVLTEWAYPGFYHAIAAALAGEPTDVQFELGKPPRPVITKTITPSPTPKAKNDDKKKNSKKKKNGSA